MLNAAAIVVLIVFSVLMVALCIFFFTMCWRRRKQNNKFLQDSPISSEPSTIKKIAEKPKLMNRKIVMIGELEKRLELLEANSHYELIKEFQQVKILSSKWEATSSVASLPENRDKNRYTDILPCNYKSNNFDTDGYITY